MRMTWDDALDFVIAAGLDRDEYFRFSTLGSADSERLRKTIIWDEKGLRYIAVWWAPGSSEGYYVHVDREFSRAAEGHRYERAMVGKFWSPARAAFASEILVRFFYGLFKDPNELLEAARKNYDENVG